MRGALILLLYVLLLFSSCGILDTGGGKGGSSTYGAINVDHNPCAFLNNTPSGCTCVQDYSGNAQIVCPPGVDPCAEVMFTDPSCICDSGTGFILCSVSIDEGNLIHTKDGFDMWYIF